MYADIIVDISVEALDRTYQYRIPESFEESVKVGTPVRVPFGRGNRVLKGFVIRITEKPAFDVAKIKDILRVEKSQVSVEGQLLQIAAFIRDRYGSTMNEALKTVLPIRKKIKSVEEHWLNFAMDERTVIDIMHEYERKHYAAKVRLLQGMLKEGGTMTRKLADAKYRVKKPVIDGLVKEGILYVTRERKYRNPLEISERPKETPPILNEEQKRIVEDFSRDYREGIRGPYLLYGITGSGKTEVYMKFLETVLESGRQAIMLIPEIALTFQTVSRFQARFGDRVAVMHSRLSEGERYDQYERARKGDVDIMIGPRSALFAPFEKLGAILIDEEHEGSYISEGMPRYHSDEVALCRAELSGASVVFGSATPSVKSYLAASEGRYKMYRLTKRAGGARLPDIHVVDLREELRAKNRSVFSRLLQEKMGQCLQRGEQMMLFINRRGYAGFVSCRNCGTVLQCPHCDVSMTAHRNHTGDVDTLICHYCGHAVKMPERCPECGSPYIAAFGLGTQKVEEMLQRLFPMARILRMDADTTSGKHGHEAVLSEFRGGKADILIGTQMIVKGHDFPNVTLVAALAADMSMFENDYQSSERTFQLLMQASGRAGRGDRCGEVVIQTYKPEHYVIESVASQNAETFYENELAYRRLMKYPPYCTMLSVSMLSEDRESGQRCMDQVVQEIRQKFGAEITLIGPAPGIVKRIKDRFRYVLYVKAEQLETAIRVKDFINEKMESEKNGCYVQYALE
ncbi:MAG: primosomal protein N' [Roseburia sp.]|nr:primosomal protein N' [Roseburia sp.]